ncbi:cytochrome P450 [Streptomyces sp. V4-01]|uniref:Cytochrome P450 n=1 Tax=Actinacidiphila polyblastidii TaxID=3110430 RepID=A0ABU7PMF7_9ACTN|nr:cytochrome P450 [Streptomyces sp. V4-01]
MPASETRGGRVVLSPAFKAEAHERYERLRAIGPIHAATFSSGLEGQLVVGYDLAREALTHPALLKDPTPAADALSAIGYVVNKPGVGLGGHMLEADPPAHTRLRRLVSGAFTPRRTAALALRIEAIAHALVDAMPPAGELDLVVAFTGPLPLTVMAELLGIPECLREDFRRMSAHALTVAAPEHRDALAGLHRLLRGLLADKRSDQGDGLLSDLIAARDEDDGRLSDDELVGTALLLIVAGHETTVNLLGTALLALLRHPAQLRLLRDAPESVPGAVEEFLRYDTSVELATHRYAAEDLELGGVPIPRGTPVVVALASAGRDAPLPHAQDPAALDVTRPAARHLAFGHGIHYCLGAPLARLEAAVALRVLLARVPLVELAVPEEDLAWIPSGMMRGLLALPVRYRRA